MGACSDALVEGSGGRSGNWWWWRGGSEGECPALAMGEGGEGLGLQRVVLLLLKDARPDGELELGDLLLYGGVDRSGLGVCGTSWTLRSCSTFGGLEPGLWPEHRESGWSKVSTCVSPVLCTGLSLYGTCVIQSFELCIEMLSA